MIYGFLQKNKKKFKSKQKIIGMTKPDLCEVLWSPSNPNRFIKFDTGDGSNIISLYQVYRDKVSELVSN